MYFLWKGSILLSFFPFKNLFLFVSLNIAIIYDLPLESCLCFGERTQEGLKKKKNQMLLTLKLLKEPIALEKYP